MLTGTVMCVPCADQSGGPRVFACDLCDYTSTHKNHFKTHKMYKHNIGVVWHFCDQPDCDFKTKQARGLKRHKAYVHDIGVVWHKCDAAPGKCDCQSKQVGKLIAGSYPQLRDPATLSELG